MACFVLPFMVLFAFIFPSAMLFHFRTAPAALSKWAEENGFRIERQRRPLLFGPYPEAALLNYGLGKAISYDETGFLGRDDALYRRQAWNFMLSGGSVFDSLDYSFSPGHEDGGDTEPNGPGGGSPALRRQLRILSDFLRKLPLENLAPDTRVVTHAAGVYARALCNPGRDYGMYLDGAGPAEITLELPPGDYSGEWLNVETGESARPENFRHAGGGRILRSPEFHDGIALRLRRSGYDR